MKFRSSLILLFTTSIVLVHAQYPGINEDIDHNRKGQLIIKARPGAKVVVEQLSHEFLFGAAISNGLAGDNWSAENQKQYREKFLLNFNSAVTENAVKWLSMEREQGKVNYTVVDGILAWAEANHIPLRGHNIFWGIEKFVHPWLKTMSNEELEKTLKDRAHDIAGRYKGRFIEYDLNNEMIHGNYYEQRLGHDITKKMAAWVHEADPTARLYLNDYDILTGKWLDKYMAQIRDLLSQGVPIAGIGVQGHLHGDTFDREALKRSLDSLAIFGLPIKVTEFNVPGQRSRYVQNDTAKMSPEQELQKASEIIDYYKICFAHPAVESILMWGFWSGANWIPESSLYRRDWSPTPAAAAYYKLIFQDWWTSTSGIMDRDGAAVIPAFYGTYRVSVDGVEKMVNLKKEKGVETVAF